MKKLIRKLRSRLTGNQGETLAEVLFALLIAALALTMLASVISSASDIIQRSKRTTDAYYNANTLLDEESVTPKAGTLTVTKSGETEVIKLKRNTASVAVNYYVNDKLPGRDVISYSKKVVVTG